MMLEPSPFLVLFYVVLPVLVSALLLYVVVRFGVKHGMRAYYSDANRPGRAPEGG